MKLPPLIFFISKIWSIEPQYQYNQRRDSGEHNSPFSFWKYLLFRPTLSPEYPPTTPSLGEVQRRQHRGKGTNGGTYIISQVHDESCLQMEFVESQTTHYLVPKIVLYLGLLVVGKMFML